VLGCMQEDGALVMHDKLVSVANTICECMYKRYPGDPVNTVEFPWMWKDKTHTLEILETVPGIGKYLTTCENIASGGRACGWCQKCAELRRWKQELKTRRCLRTKQEKYYEAQETNP